MFLSNDFIIFLFVKDLAGAGWSILFLLLIFSKHTHRLHFSWLYASDLTLHEKITSFCTQRDEIEYSRRERKIKKWFKGRNIRETEKSRDFTDLNFAIFSF